MSAGRFEMKRRKTVREREHQDGQVCIKAYNKGTCIENIMSINHVCLQGE